MQATYTNALTAGVWTAARLPIALENDRVVLETALSRVRDPETVRMGRIANTLHLETFWVSAALLPELRALGGMEVDESPVELRFGGGERLLPFPPAGR
jgi:hypothetical protein